MYAQHRKTVSKHSIVYPNPLHRIALLNHTWFIIHLNKNAVGTLLTNHSFQSNRREVRETDVQKIVSVIEWVSLKENECWHTQPCSVIDLVKFV